MSEEIIKRLMETGKVTLGTKTTIKLLKAGKAKAVVISSNCPKEAKGQIETLAKEKKTKLYVYPGTSLELGEACGKPFPVSAIGIENPGDADISKLGVSK